MSVWVTRYIDPRVNLSSVALITVAVLVVGLALWDGPIAGSRTASQINAFDEMQDRVFSQPIPVVWSGTIQRVLVSGEGLEIINAAAPGGVFQASMGPGEISPLLQGVVDIQGFWQGWTCAYGGAHGHCVPDVQIQSIRPHRE